jgi:hypothetical protein
LPETLAPTALCTDEDVRLYLGIKPSDLDVDDRDVLIRLVNAASETFTDESQRLWIGNGSTRIYPVDQAALEAYEVRIDDCRSVTDVTAGYYDSVDVPAAVAPFYLRNYDNTLDPPLTRLKWPTSLALGLGTELFVVGIFGWADDYTGVPEKVRQAVIVTAAEWYARDVQKFSATFSLDENRVFIPRMLPSSVQAIAESYRRFRAA